MAERCQFPNMNYQLAPYQPLISRRIEFAPQQLPAAPMVSRRMEFGMRKLKNRLPVREKTPDHSVPSELFLPLSPLWTRSRSQTPALAERLPSMPTSRFAARSPVTTRQKTPPTTRFSHTKSLRSNGVRFGIDEDHDVDDRQNGTDLGGEEDSGNKIAKPPGEPGRPKSGGYKLESVLGWNEATFEAVRVGL